MSTTFDIGILGADGRMGGAIIRQLNAEPGVKLTAALTAPDSPHIGKDCAETAGLAPCGVSLTSSIPDALELCDVLIDFSHPKAAIDAALSMHNARCHTFVTGTTGYTNTEEQALIKAGDSITLVKSGNFSLGVNMLAALVELAAQKLNSGWDVEVLEMHHRHKIDAPSGTALMLGEAAAQGRGMSLKDTQVLDRSGRKSARKDGQIGFAALRGGGVVGQHEVRIASELEMITLGHEALDRSVFAAGAVAAALWAVNKPTGLYSMQDVLEIS